MQRASPHHDNPTLALCNAEITTLSRSRLASDEHASRIVAVLARLLSPQVIRLAVKFTLLPTAVSVNINQNSPATIQTNQVVLVNFPGEVFNQD
jgi:hypothetical protein